MPELPEVETVRRGLAPVLEGAQIARVWLGRADLRFPFPERFAERLTGARVLRLERRAKYLLAPLDTGEVWAAHLGMTGRFSVTSAAGVARPGDFYYAAPPDPKHTHVRLWTAAGAEIAYNDVRRFGSMTLIEPGGLARHPLFASLGPEPLGPELDAASLAGALAGRTTSIKAALLDQRIVAGLGNIYVCEALHRARISPLAPAGAVAPARLAALVKAIRAVLLESLEVGGSSLRDYAGADGAKGAFQNAFSVYDREEQPCLRPRCNGLVARAVQAGRSSFWCPRCQR
jgi:formamidopyrimidine-DNA glycosylase